MSDQQQAPVQQGDIAAPARHEAQAALLDALVVNAKKAAAQDSAAESKDFSASCLALAQAITVLDPQRLAGGDTPAARLASMPTPPPVKDADKDGKIGE